MNDIPWKFYSWKDIERYCLRYREQWQAYFHAIDVYPSEIVICKKNNISRNTDEILKDMFHEKYLLDKRQVLLDDRSTSIAISEEDAVDANERQMRPLFRDVLYSNNAYPDLPLPELPREVIAFHSYKGGVGRTLSLLAFAKAWPNVFSTGKQSRLLMVDADLEAPGLSWLQEEEVPDALSYLDLLTMIQDSSDVDRVVSRVCEQFRFSRISVETSQRRIEHYFMPVYRYKEQILDMYADPQSIVNRKENAYILAEILSKIAERLELGAVLVDLRAGLSEHSSTLLFDRRVKKYLVTSTSSQSLKGTEILLDYILTGLPSEDSHQTVPVPEVLVNMVQVELEKEEKLKILSSLRQKYEQLLDESNNTEDDLSDNVITKFTDNVTELAFASELVHLTSLTQIFRTLHDRKLYSTIENLIKNNYMESYSKDNTEDLPKAQSPNRNTILEAIHKLADQQLTAENGHETHVLTIKPLRELRERFQTRIPSTVIMGTKGAGKTFLFMQMADASDWNSFCNNAFKTSKNQENGYFIPILSSLNMQNIYNILKKCVKKLNDNVNLAKAKESVCVDNYQELRKLLDDSANTNNNWYERWEKLLVSSLNKDLSNFMEMNDKLHQEGKKVIFLIDGLEDCFTDCLNSEKQKDAVRVLVQEIVLTLSTQFEHLGIVIFFRKDIARAAITTNWAQFEKSYQSVELKWTPDEAKRLVVWLTELAHMSIDNSKHFYQENTPIEDASTDVIDKYLIKLWGQKLGAINSREARSSPWILAALSDFNGLLQARDMIRFLKYVTESAGTVETYSDRLLLPSEIRKAIPKCATEKIDEIKEEYKELQDIFKKITDLQDDKKRVPLNPEHIQMNNAIENNMVQVGWLRRTPEGYFFPEMVRHALSLKYKKGARPSVLSFFREHP